MTFQLVQTVSGCCLLSYTLLFTARPFCANHALSTKYAAQKMTAFLMFADINGTFYHLCTILTLGFAFSALLLYFIILPLTFQLYFSTHKANSLPTWWHGYSMVSAHVSEDGWQQQRNNESSSQSVAISLLPIHTHGPKLLFCLQALFLYLRPRAHSVLLPILTSIYPSTCPSVRSLDTWKEAEKVIYSSFQDIALSPIYSSPTLFWSLHRYEPDALAIL